MHVIDENLTYAVGQISLANFGLISAISLAHPCLKSRIKYRPNFSTQTGKCVQFVLSKSFKVPRIS